MIQPRLSARLQPVMDEFLAEVRAALGERESGNINLHIGDSARGYTVYVYEKGGYLFAQIDADMPGGPEAVAQAIHDEMIDKRPELT